MEKPFRHFLITRYNIRLENWEKDARGQTTLDEAWMNHRFDLFTKYCFPSVVAQSIKDFTWLIYVESSTSETQLEKILTITAPYPFIQLRQVNGYFGCMHDIDQTLTNAPSHYVITSRLDNDDGYGINYIKIVQDHFIPRDRTMINLLNGYGYMPERKIPTLLFHIERNSFCSFIEQQRPKGGHISVRGFQHGLPPEGTIIKNVESQGGWIKIFHTRNLLSKPFGYPVFSNRFKRFFGIEDHYLKINILSALLYCPLWALDGISRKWKEAFRLNGKRDFNRKTAK